MLLVLTAAFATGALFIKYKLESVRAVILRAAESKTGTHLEVGSVYVTGLRGIRIDDLRVTVETPEGPKAHLSVPNAYVFIDLVDLINGDIVVERVQIDNAVARIERPADHGWFSRGALSIPGATQLATKGAFRVLGRNCSLEVDNIIRNTRLDIRALDFDVFRLPDSSDVLAKASGSLNGVDSKRVDATVFFTSLDEFELKAECTEIATDDVNVFLPASQRFIESGVVHPKVRLVGYPDKTLMVWLEAPFEDISIRNHPPFLKPATGTLTVLADYDITSHVLSFNTSKAESEQIGGGEIDGSIAFREEKPSFDLRLKMDRLPIQEILDRAVEGRAEEYGIIDMTLGDPYEVALTLTGDIENPRISAKVNAAAGTLSFQPNSTSLPKADLQLASLEASWDSTSKKGGLSLGILAGEVVHDGTGLHAKGLTGRLGLEDNTLTLDPLNADIRGQAIVASLVYDLAQKKGRASVSGTLTELEKTKLATIGKGIELAGAITFHGEASIEPNLYKLDLDVQGTQTEVDYSWYLAKPIGLGTSAKLHAEIVPRKKAAIVADVTAAGTSFTSKLNFKHNGRKLQLEDSDSLAEKIDIGIVAKCLKLPYEASGGTARQVHYVWTRDKNAPDSAEATLTCNIDELHLTPQGSEQEHILEDANLELTFTQGNAQTGALKLSVANAIMAPFGNKWFVPMRCPPELEEKYPPTDRSWTYDLAAARMEASPWKGENFAAQGYYRKDESGFSHYSANVDEGRIAGSYRHDRTDNTYAASIDWENVGAGYFIKHLKFPDMLSGPVTGKVSYTVDYDDPTSLQGAGSFVVTNGQFSPDFVFAQFQKQMEEDMGMIPPSLKFSRLSANVNFLSRRVETDPLELVAEGITIVGKGYYVPNGHMDYELDLAVSPDTADKIQVLRDNFNVHGYRLANKDIELKFRVNGPTLRPKSELAEVPPASVTLVSGALQATSDAMKVIDIPRKLLVDVVKIGAGIMGARKTPGEGNK